MSIENMTAEQCRAAARECEQRAIDSFDRCDTDGFLSQWASGLTAQMHRLQAQVVEAGGVWEFSGLYCGRRRLAAKVIRTAYGSCWLLRDDEAAKYGRRFIPRGGNSRVQRQMGLTERSERVAAYARICSARWA